MMKMRYLSFCGWLLMFSLLGCTSLIPSPGKILREGISDVVRSSNDRQEENESGGIPQVREEKATGQNTGTKTVLSCIEENDLDGLKRLVGNTRDIKTLVPQGSLLIEKAILALGHSDQTSTLLPYLVEKKAFVYQRDSEGKTILDKLYWNEMGDSSQAKQVENLLLPIQRSWEDALKNDRPQEIAALVDKVDAKDWLILDALTWKAPAVFEYAVKNAYPIDHAKISLGELFAEGKRELSESDLNRMLKTALDAGISADAALPGRSTALQMILVSNKGFESTAILLHEAGAAADGRMLFSCAFTNSWMKLADYAIAKGHRPDKHFISWAKLETIPWFLANGWAPADFIGPVRAMDRDKQRQSISLLMRNGLTLSTLTIDWVGDRTENLSYMRSLGVAVEGSLAVSILVRNKRPISEVEEYLRLKADPNGRDYQGNTPLHMAVMHNNLPLVRLLLSYGADINAANKNSRTPLGYCPRNAEELRAVLVAAGAR